MCCIIKGCEDKVYVKKHGLCSRHYNRLRTTGTVNDTRKSRASVEERFWRHVDKKAANECWLWTAKSRIKGYGVIGLGGRNKGKILAHRLSWIIHNGQLPAIDDYHGAVVMHTCDNRLCVNPRHLMVGRQQDNVRDMDQKGRRINGQLKAEKHQNAKFTNHIVMEMRSSDLSDAEWARKLSVTRQAVSYARRRGWKSLNTEDE